MTSLASVRAATILAALSLVSTTSIAQQRSAPPPAPARSAPVANVRYEVTFDSAAAARRTLKVTVTLDVGGPGNLLLSFPAWTPGSYELSNFARFVSGFAATGGTSLSTGTSSTTTPGGSTRRARAA